MLDAVGVFVFSDQFSTRRVAAYADASCTRCGGTVDQTGRVSSGSWPGEVR
jgi:hypothetical protein